MIGSVITKPLVARGFRNLSDRKIDKFLASWRKDAVFVFPGDVPVSGTHKGLEEIQQFFERMLEQFPSFSFTVKKIAVSNLFDLIGNNTVLAEWELHGTNRDGVDFQNHGVTRIQIRLGKIVSAREYLFDLQIVRRAWGEER